MNDMQPLVTIIAVCYNHEKYVEETLNSIVNQTYKNIQLIIMDDFSSDNSVQIINEWIEKNKKECTFIPHKQNQGLCKTLNEALTYTKGQYYQAISCDDVLMPEKILKQINVFFENPAIAVVCSNVLEIDEKSNILPKKDSNIEFVYGLRKSEELFKTLISRNIINAPTVLIRKEYIPITNVYDENLISEDWDLWLKLAYNYDFYFMNEYLVKYRIIGSSMSNTKVIHDKIIYQCIYILKKYLGVNYETDKLIKKEINKLKSKFYKYSLKALIKGQTPFFEFVIKYFSSIKYFISKSKKYFN